MKTKIKERIGEFVSYIEKMNDEGKLLTTQLSEIVDKFKSEEDENLKKNLAAEYFAIQQYLGLMSKDINKAMVKVSECYLMATLTGFDLELSEDEQKIVDGYVKETSLIFSVIGNGIVPKNPDLLKIMKQRALDIKNEPFILEIIKNAK